MSGSDTLYGALIGLARSSENNTLVNADTYKIMVRALAIAAGAASAEDQPIAAGAASAEDHTGEMPEGLAASGGSREEDERAGNFINADGSRPGQEIFEDQIAAVRKEKHRLVPKCASCANPCGRTAEYDLKEAEKNEDPSLAGARRCLLRRLSDLAYMIEEKIGPDMVPEDLKRELEGLFAWGLFEAGYEETEKDLGDAFSSVVEYESRLKELA